MKVCGKLTADWVKQFNSLPRSTFLDFLKLPSTAAVYLSLKCLSENKQDPLVMRELLLDMQQWIKSTLPPEIFIPEAVVTQQVVSTGNIVLPVRMDDIIQLTAKTETATTVLEKCGRWWKIVQAAHRPNRQPQWFLRSLTRQEQGLSPIKNFKFDVTWILKEDDPNYQITRVCPFPKVFDYKEYE